MNGVSHVWTPESLREWTDSCSGQKPDGSWGPIRPVLFWGLCLRRRCKLAWRVFTGKADVLEWDSHDK